MDANKDAALHYLELAEKAIHVHDNDRAIRYINKSQELFATQKAKDLLEKIKNSTNHSYHKTDDATINDYTPEEVEAVRKIKTCKDLYEILGVDKKATEADLKKAYRKLALQFHPDKCKAPGATEAFKAIGKAFSILNDPKKREQYDQYGHAMEPQYHRSSTNDRRNYYYCDEDDDFSAEELFNLFFGYSGPTSRSYRRRQQANSFRFTNYARQNTTHTFTQLLPYLILFLISILGTFFVSESQFQLHRTGKYSNLRRTRTFNIEYYVKSDFRLPKTDAELEQFESTVIDEYVAELKHQCYRERQYQESLIWRARMMNDKHLYEEAQRQTTPSCTKLNDLLRNFT